MEAWIKKVQKTSVAFVGFPCGFGQGKAGVEEGPAMMRKHGMIEQFDEFNIPVTDLGDVEVQDFKDNEKVHNMKKARSVGEANKKLSEVVRRVVEEGKLCVPLGGDHCMGIGSVYGHSQASPGLKVIWVDAHSDINPPLESSTSNIHGMPVCFLAKELKHLIPDNLLGFDWFKPCISLKDIVYIGLRSVDQAERKLLQQHKIKAFCASDVSRHGIDEILKQALEYLKPSKEHPINLNIDIDALDPIHSASTGTPVTGGLSLREGINIVETVSATGFMEVLTIAEVNPALGTEAQRNATLESANELVAAAFCKRSTFIYPE